MHDWIPVVDKYTKNEKKIQTVLFKFYQEDLFVSKILLSIYIKSEKYTMRQITCNINWIT